MCCHTIILIKVDNIMEDFPKYYTRLFNGITDAIEALQAQNCIKAQDFVIKSQQDAEEMYLEDGKDERRAAPQVM